MFLVLSYLSYCFISPRPAGQDLLKELVQSHHKRVYPCHLLLLLIVTWWAPPPLPPPTPCPRLTRATPCWWAPLTPCSPCLRPPPWRTACSPPCWAPRRSWSVIQLVLHLLVCHNWKLWARGGRGASIFQSLFCFHLWSSTANSAPAELSVPAPPLTTTTALTAHSMLPFLLIKKDKY